MVQSDDDDVYDGHHHLETMEFILPLDPGVRVLHYLYLGDALGVGDASELAANGGKYDEMLEEVGALLPAGDGGDVGPAGDGAGSGGAATDADATLLERIGSILDSRLPAAPSHRHPRDGRRQHLCLLRQYALNRRSGRSVRGTTMVYVRPHVSTYYRGGNDSGVPSSSSSSSSQGQRPRVIF